MVLATPSITSVVRLQHYDRSSWQQKTLKRKLDVHSVPVLATDPFAYPSPPMSVPPSPSEAPPAVATTTATTRGPSLPTATEGPVISPAIGYPATTVFPPQQNTYDSPSFVPASQYGSAAEVPTHQGQRALPPHSSSTIDTAAAQRASSAGPSTSRAGRRSKAHVASACVNCKRAHLSCDIQRPCERCVNSGKQVCHVRASCRVLLKTVCRTHASTFSTRNVDDHAFAKKESSSSSKRHLSRPGR